MKFLNFILLNFLFYFSLLKFINNFIRNLSFSDRLIVSFILHLFSLYFIFSIFGYFHLISFEFLVIFYVFFIFVFSIVGKDIVSSYKKLFKEIFKKLNELKKILKQNLILSLLFLLFFIQMLLIFRFYFVYPPQGWDGYAYHLPIASRIFIERGIPTFETFSDAIYHLTFPKNVEFLYSLYYIFCRTDRGILTVQIPFLIFGILALYSILKKLGIRKEKALFVISVSFMPIITHQLTVAYVDLPVNMMFVIFLNFLINKDFLSEFFSIIAISIGAGIKWTLFPVFLFSFYISL